MYDIESIGSQYPGTFWINRHLAAIRYPKDMEVPIVSMLRGWIDYANKHQERYETGIGNDGVLGDEWEAIGKALIGLLNGECGRLDCGTIDGLIRRTLTAEGFDADM